MAHKYKLKKGWTKAKVLKQFKKYNNGTRAVDTDGTCEYQSSTGNRCAVGAFISDTNKEALQVEGNVGALFEQHPEVADSMPLSKAGLNKMQEYHDNLAKDDGRFKGDTHAAITNFLKVRVE